MTSVTGTHAIVGLDPDAVTCICNAVFSYDEYGGSRAAKEAADQHVASRSSSVAPPAWADLRESDPDDQAWASTELADGHPVGLSLNRIDHGDRQGPTTVRLWFDNAPDRVELPDPETAIAAGASLLIGGIRARAILNDEPAPEIEEELDNDDSLLFHQIASRPSTVVGWPFDIVDDGTGTWSISIPSSTHLRDDGVHSEELSPHDARVFLLELAEAIAVAERLNRGDAK